MNNKAFTLVELIVVITILAVLATIWFMSFLWYTENSRDSARLSDLTSVSKVIDIYEIDSWKYPSNTNPFDVTYGSEIVFTQWTFWDKTISAILGLINTAPLDPKTWNEYSYSLTSDGSEYEISWILEWSDYALFQWNQANAWSVSARSLVRWNYNWEVLQKTDWWNILLLASPSITVNSDTVTWLSQIAAENRFVYGSNNNLAYIFEWTNFDTHWSSDIILVNDSAIELYNWSVSDINLDTNLLSSFQKLQNAYNWTFLSDNYRIWKTLSYDLVSEEDASLKYIRYLYNTLIWNIVELAD